MHTLLIFLLGTPEVKRVGYIPHPPLPFYFLNFLFCFVYFCASLNLALSFPFDKPCLQSVVRTLAYWHWKLKIILPVVFQIAFCQSPKVFWKQRWGQIGNRWGIKMETHFPFDPVFSSFSCSGFLQNFAF